MRQGAIAVIAAMFATFGWAAQPDIRNAQVITEAAQPDLQQKVNDILRFGRVAWVGYEVQTVGAHRNSYNGCGDVHYLEGDRGQTTFSDRQTSTAILLRTENQAISKVDVVSTECHIDGGGLPVYWLTGVDGDQSVRLLSDLANNHVANPAGTKRLTDSALFAVAIHRVSSATQMLNDLARNSRDKHLKEQAAFWLGTQRGHDGFLALKDLTRDTDSEFRKKLTFDMSQNSDPGAVDELIRMAKTDEAPDVRGQAIFWLAQKASKKQAAMIADIAVSDPDRG